MPRYLTSPQLQEKGHPYSRQHTTRLEQKGLFPKRIRLGPMRVVWNEDEIEAHYASRERGALPIRVQTGTGSV
jgi:predicted DNA-binding transcriptional regulator AlpA